MWGNIHELKEAGIISESRSPYASPVVVVHKENGTTHMCVDYRTLNKRTIQDQCTIPKVEDALACLSGSCWFGVLDLRSGNYQTHWAWLKRKKKTAFMCSVRFYQFERMPQGISVGDTNLLEVLIYLDDVVVFGRRLEEHELCLLKVLDRLK